MVLTPPSTQEPAPPPHHQLQHQLCQSLAGGLAVADATSLPAIAADATTTRFRRCLVQPTATRQPCWDPLLPELLAAGTSTAVTLILDPTTHADRLTSRVIGLAHHQRAVPLTWHGVAAQARWRDQFAPAVREMVQPTAAALPPGRTVTLLADAGLTSPFLVDGCRSVGWHWVVRMSVTPNGWYLLRSLFRPPDGQEQRIAEWLPDPATPPRRRTRTWAGQVVTTAGGRDGWVTMHEHPAHAAP